MKKLQKLSLSKLALEQEIISTEEQIQIYAGSGIDGLGFYEGIEITSIGLPGNEYHSENYYIQNYASTHGGFSSIISGGSYLGVKGGDTLSYLEAQL
jgi:hypothetical protein